MWWLTDIVLANPVASFIVGLLALTCMVFAF